MPTIEISENKPRYGHSPILAISAARRSRMVTNTCVPNKTTRPTISTANIILLNLLANGDRSTASYQLPVRPAIAETGNLRGVFPVTLQVTFSSYQRLAFLER